MGSGNARSRKAAAGTGKEDGGAEVVAGLAAHGHTVAAPEMAFRVRKCF